MKPGPLSAKSRAMVGKGRQKIELKLIEKKEARLACFSKRRMGLFKKARELSVLCGATVAALAFSPAGKPMPFDVPALEALIDLKCPVSPELPPQVEVEAAAAETSPTFGDWESEFREAMVGKSSASSSGDWESEFHEAMDGKSATLWWERADVQCMGLEELRRFERSILGYKEKQMKDFDDLQEQPLQGERLLLDMIPCTVGSSSSSDPILDDWEDGWLTMEEFEDENLEPADPCTTFLQQLPAALKNEEDVLLPIPIHFLHSFVQNGYISIWDF